MIDRDTDDQGRPVTSSGRLLVTFVEGTEETQIQEILTGFEYDRPFELAEGFQDPRVRALSRTYRVRVPVDQEDEISLALRREHRGYIERVERPAMRYVTTG